MLNSIIVEAIRVISQLVTGKLLTDEQIRSISGNIVGTYVSDWFPKPKEEHEASKRVEVARAHITEATRIILDLRTDLDNQATHLDQLVAQIAEKEKLAEHYATLAQTNQAAFAPLRAEMERVLREQLVAQANKGKRLRQALSFIAWIITLILGAALGVYFPAIVAAIKAALKL
jgi:hypothetical protein